MKKILIAILLFICACGTSDTSTEVKRTPEEMLAILDGDLTPDTNDVKVIRYKFLLNHLSELYGESRDTIADWTSKCHSVLHDHGIAETHLNLLEEMKKVGKVDNTPYRDAITFYTMLRTQ